jgi:hypothetical protein
MADAVGVHVSQGHPAQPKHAEELQRGVHAGVCYFGVTWVLLCWLLCCKERKVTTGCLVLHLRVSQGRPAHFKHAEELRQGVHAGACYFSMS